MKLEKCFNCGENPVIESGTDGKYKFSLTHHYCTCAFRVYVTHDCEKTLIEGWNQLNKFPEPLRKLS